MNCTTNQNALDYERIAKAIEFISSNVPEQPSLEEIATHVHLSAPHFQRLFNRWAGVSPKQFLQTLTLEHAKNRLQESSSLLNASNDTGLSSSSRLYDHFVTLEAVTPGEFKSGGEGLELEYGLISTAFGNAMVAFTSKGINRLVFIDSESQENFLAKLARDWPRARIESNQTKAEQLSKQIFNGSEKSEVKLSLYVSGTNFQINVWKSLLKIPSGSIVSYSQIASDIDKPKAARAVGTAIGANPVGFLIPCHRVIQQSGALGGYRWGTTRKQAMLFREASARG